MASSDDIPPNHQPIPFGRYFDIHSKVMSQFKQTGWVFGETLEFVPLPGQGYILAGEIACRGRIVIRVRKLLRYVDPSNPDDDRIGTVTYSYNVSVRGVGNIFRYDNAHAHSGHGDEHHRHQFDMNGACHPPAEWIGVDKWPHLSHVISEARDWHSDNYSTLSDAEGFVPVEHLRSATDVVGGVRIADDLKSSM